MSSLKNAFEATFTKVKLILWKNQNSIFKKTLCIMPGDAYLLVGVGAPEDMSIVSFMLLATGFG